MIAPKWWIETISKSNQFRHFNHDHKYHLNRLYQNVSTVFMKEYSIWNDDLYFKKSKIGSIADSPRETDESKADYIEFAHTANLIVICNHSTDGEVRVICSDVKSGKILWKNRTWSHEHPASRYILVEPVITKERVVVFGTMARDIFVESFDLKDGNPLMKFNSRLWNHKYSPFSSER